MPIAVSIRTEPAGIIRGKSAADGTFALQVPPGGDLNISAYAPEGGGGKSGLVVKAGEKTDVGEIKLAKGRL